jgi:hypothetical protein
MRYPHPYFGCKQPVFMNLQTWLRRKIVKTKEFSAKSSNERSYVDDWRELLRIIVRRRGEIICNHLRWGRRSLFACLRFVGSNVWIGRVRLSVVDRSRSDKRPAAKAGFFAGWFSGA